MISIMCLVCFQKPRQIFIDNCLKNPIDCFDKQSIVFLESVKTVNQNVISDFNDFSNLFLIQKILMEHIFD